MSEEDQISGVLPPTLELFLEPHNVNSCVCSSGLQVQLVTAAGPVDEEAGSCKASSAERLLLQYFTLSLAAFFFIPPCL